MSDSLDTAATPLDIASPAPAGEGAGTVSVREAARRLGISDRTVRRRIQDGLLPAQKHETEHGYEWRVPLDSMDAGPPGMLPRHADPLPGTGVQGGGTAAAPPVEGDDARAAPDLMKALEIIESIQRERETARLQHEEKVEALYGEVAELKGSTAHWQARALIAEEQARRAEEQVRLLMAPKDEPAEPEPPAEPVRVSWWRRLLHGG